MTHGQVVPGQKNTESSSSSDTAKFGPVHRKVRQTASLSLRHTKSPNLLLHLENGTVKEGGGLLPERSGREESSDPGRPFLPGEVEAVPFVFLSGGEPIKIWRGKSQEELRIPRAFF